jgi:hypothetical protein
MTNVVKGSVSITIDIKTVRPGEMFQFLDTVYMKIDHRAITGQFITGQDDNPWAINLTNGVPFLFTWIELGFLKDQAIMVTPIAAATIRLSNG